MLGEKGGTKTTRIKYKTWDNSNKESFPKFKEYNFHRRICSLKLSTKHGIILVKILETYLYQGNLSLLLSSMTERSMIVPQISVSWIWK